ncbi:MAG TPA: hypothetical protein VGL53_05520 [Bryobacteraceae bacterium]|jgi:hypothetical protein
MSYHDDLLGHAMDALTRASPSQADLRRSVSTAYYALFHLLISETVDHWDLESSRGALARMFEHSVMRKVSKRVADPKQFPFASNDPVIVQRLRYVAESFAQLQYSRQIADYDNSIIWSLSDARAEVDTAVDAFKAWQSIRHEKIAEDYLVSLLIKPRD